MFFHFWPTGIDDANGRAEDVVVCERIVDADHKEIYLFGKLKVVSYHKASIKIKTTKFKSTR